MATFEDALPVILRHEGGWVNNPADPGGATNYGVSLRYARTVTGVNLDIDCDGDIDVDDIKALTVEHATAVYRQWWDRYRYGRVLNQQVATKIFDTSINTGPRPAHRILQRALRDLGQRLTVDGVLGDKTLIATNRSHSELLLNKLVLQQSEFYRNLVEARPSLIQFLPQWLRRAAWPLRR